jgi:hypothetical protein
MKLHVLCMCEWQAGGSTLPKPLLHMPDLKLHMICFDCNGFLWLLAGVFQHFVKCMT